MKSYWLISLFFGLAATQSLQAQKVNIQGEPVEPAVWETLTQIGVDAGELSLVVRAKERTAVDQARMMYKALIRYEKQNKDGAAILRDQHGDVVIPALKAFKEYRPDGKDLTIEYMAYHIEETVKTLRALPQSDPQSRDLRYVMPLAYHLVEIDAGSLKNAAKFEASLEKAENVLHQFTLKPGIGKARACANCYLVAIAKKSP